MTKTQYGILALALLTAFASGRFLTPTKTITEVKTVTIEKIVEVKDTDEKKTTTVVQKPDGTTTTTTTSDTTTHTSTTDDTSKATDSKKTVENNKSRYSLGFLAGTDITNLTKGYSPGLIGTVQFIGPIDIVGQGFLNGQVAAGLLLHF